ncbi:hypothetical protein RDWZM_007789 [Blomia tropicalis]|uniref:Ras-GEF domain-containing protein n=1 Tax=Blomia tropicalis TaxID=40697 RepID=A0A9Q0M367_BLOTA|nr:hypothetical protein RDWZM_007789 [Blomia tropicalis]
MSKSIRFDLNTNNNRIQSNEDEKSPKIKNKNRFTLFKSSSSSESLSSDSLNNYNKKEIKQKEKLLNYLNTEKQFVKKKIEIDEDERILLDSLGNTVIDLDKYLKLPEAKAKDKLWRIPYYFRDSSLDDGEEDNGDKLRSINRFGEGIKDGCFVTLTLPAKSTPKNDDKKWRENIESKADEALEQFERAKWTRLNRIRRGSILQPRHVFLSPNPELGNCEKLLLLGHCLSIRDWTSELFLGISKESNALLDDNYKRDICHNTSLEDLNNMLFPDLKTSKSSTTESVPPCFGGQSDLQFRRQSFAGGELWSAKLEKDRKRQIYHQRLQMINPNVEIPPEREKSPLELIMAANMGLNMNQQMNQNDYLEFNYKSKEEARLFAHELTLIVRQHFVAINESEIVNFITHTGSHVLSSCPNIKAFFHLKTRITRLIATYILHHEQLDQRAEAILFFINVIRQLNELGNWNSINVITQSLQCPPIVRLKDTWRKITFNNAEEYCYFIQVSEDLASGQQLECYDSLDTFLAIFDDVADKIKERCGFKILQIHQHRLHSSWDNTREDDIMNWVNMKLAKQSRGLVVDEKSEIGENFDLDRKYEKRLLSGQQLTCVGGRTNRLPSCSKFWSITEFHKLNKKDKEQVKQEIVRTLVAFQKKAFYVFEERDEEIKDFLLNSKCDSMEACMLKSRTIEGDTKKDYAHKDVQTDSETSPSMGIICYRSRTNTNTSASVDPDESDDAIEQSLNETRIRTRRVMFAQDLDTDSE